MLVSLNGILQKPGSSFTISGATITFASNLATGDVIDFIILLGNVLDIGAPSDGTVTNAKLAQDIISGETALASEPADTDEFLVSDAGTLKRIDYSLIKGSSRYTLLATTTVTSAVASVEFTSDIDSTYRTYLLTINNLIPVTDNTQLQLQIYVGGAYKTDSYYHYCNNMVNAGGSHESQVDKTSGHFRLHGDGIGNATGENFSGEVRFFTPSDTTEFKIFQWENCFPRNDAELTHTNGAGYYNNGQAALTGLKLYMSSGNIDTGQFKLFGVV